MSVSVRRTYLKADLRRAQILDVAKGVFTRRGYRVANVGDICKAARIARGTLYQYFDNKQAVLLALMEDIGERIGRVLDERPRLAEVPLSRNVPVEMVVAFTRKRTRELFDAIWVDEPTLRLIFRDARGLDGAVDRVIAEIDDRVLAAMEDDLKAVQKAGIFRQGDPRLISRYCLGGAEKVILTALTKGEPVDLDAVVEVIVEMELFGLLSEEVRDAGKA